MLPWAPDFVGLCVVNQDEQNGKKHEAEPEPENLCKRGFSNHYRLRRNTSRIFLGNLLLNKTIIETFLRG